MKRLTLLLVLFAAPAPAHELARTWANRPPCDAGQDGPTFLLTDPVDATDCATGGGTAQIHYCTCDNGTWKRTEPDDGHSHTASTVADVYLFNTGDTATGDYDFASSTLKINSAGGDVGIGTASPSAKLHVDGDTDVLSAVFEANNNQVRFEDSLTGQTWALRQTSDLGIRFRDIDGGTEPFFIAATAPTSSLLINAAGRVGMGTSTPTTKLDVEGTIQGDDITCETAGCIDNVELATIDVSSKTNLAVTAPITLTGDTLGLQTLGGDVTGSITATVVGNDSHTHGSSTITGGAIVPSGSRIVFFQASCPSGWTQVTTAALDGAALRFETSTGGGSGGSKDISSAQTDSHTLTESEMPGHTHTFGTGTGTGSLLRGQQSLISGSSGTTSSTGGGSGHDHGLSFLYANVIICEAP